MTLKTKNPIATHAASNEAAPLEQRANVYYWKCDRPSVTIKDTPCDRIPRKDFLLLLTDVVSKALGASAIELRNGLGQGNHLTFTTTVKNKEYFIRVEYGPEQDSFMEIETEIIREVNQQGVPVPHVFAVDASRHEVPFAWQIMEKIPANDLGSHNIVDEDYIATLASEIGTNVAKWQNVKVSGFGPFSSQVWRDYKILKGLHRNYHDYFYLQLSRHLKIITDHRIISSNHSAEIFKLFEQHNDLIDLKSGCLVHKDLAFWNILGEKDNIMAFIDWEDAISGDPMDDLSLLGCFHSGSFIEVAFNGYQQIKPLPDNYLPRFWIHLLRNIVMKAVIRVIGGFFEKNDNFFLIAKGSDGEKLKKFTCNRIQAAMEGLRYHLDIRTLG